MKYADIPEKDSNIGDLECNGTLKLQLLFFKGCKNAVKISAETPEETPQKRRNTKNFWFEMLILEKRWWGWYLEHVSYGDKYWYKEDLAL